MSASALSQRIAEQRPELSSLDVARMTLLLLTSEPNAQSLDEEQLARSCDEVAFRLESVVDQYGAVAAEVDRLFSDGPAEYSPEQLWTLLKAVKVQSQLIDLYTDVPALA
ncbi:MAG: hypothetical protein AAF664_07700 [Planctomycetota bacterium]